MNTICWCFGRYQYDSKDGSNRATIRVNSNFVFKLFTIKFSDPDIVENRGNWNVGLEGSQVHRKSQSPIRKLFNALSPDSFMNRSKMGMAFLMSWKLIKLQKKSMKLDGVNEDELKEIKQDISSLRFELRDDRRKEIVRSSSHIDAVKREIMRSKLNWQIFKLDYLRYEHINEGGNCATKKATFSEGKKWWWGNGRSGISRGFGRRIQANYFGGK